MASRKIAFIVNPNAAMGYRREWPRGMWVAPGASVGYGLFHVTVIGDLTLAEVFLNLPKPYNGKTHQSELFLTDLFGASSKLPSEKSDPIGPHRPITGDFWHRLLTFYRWDTQNNLTAPDI